MHTCYCVLQALFATTAVSPNADEVVAMAQAIVGVDVESDVESDDEDEPESSAELTRDGDLGMLQLCAGSAAGPSDCVPKR